MGSLHLPPDQGVFRRAAIQERAEAAEPAPVLEVSPPWTWAVTLAVVAALVLGAWGLLRVPVTAADRGRGVVRIDETGAAGVVAFVPARGHAWLKVGDGVVVQGDPADGGEKAAAAGMVVRIDVAPAPAQEVRAAVGDAAPPGPVYRVEVNGGPRLPAGSPVTVWLRPRRQTLGALVFEPARRLLR